MEAEFEAGGAAFLEIAQLFAKVADNFLHLRDRPESMRGLWDAALPAPLYVAEEQGELMTSWDAFEAYFKNTGQLLAPVVCRYDLKLVVPLAQDLVSAYCEMGWKTAILPATEEIGGFVRVVAVLRAGEAGWRFVSYVEAPLAPAIYLQELYKMVARVG